jgi:TerC family integral membrane protein
LRLSIPLITGVLIADDHPIVRRRHRTASGAQVAGRLPLPGLAAGDRRATEARGHTRMLEVTIAGWAGTIGLIVGLFVLDLFASRPGHAHVAGFREAAVASIFFVGVALGLGIVFGVIAGWDHGSQYFAGYIVEKSLSVDDLFVFVVIMSTFAVPEEHEQRLLTFGILAALGMRAIFIALGAALISAFSFMFLIFGLLLVTTAIQLFRHRDEDPDVEDDALVRITRRAMPVTSAYDGG